MFALEASNFSQKHVMSNSLELYQFGSFLPQTYTAYQNDFSFQLETNFGVGSGPYHSAARDFKPKTMPMSDSCVLKLKGLPYATTEEEIYEFFKEYEVRKVAFVLESDGRPSGLAFAEFDSIEEALRALQKNGEYIGERYVKLLHVPKQEMEEQVKFGTAAIPKTPKPRPLSMAIPAAALYGVPNFIPQSFISSTPLGVNPLTSKLSDSILPQGSWRLSHPHMSSLSLPSPVFLKSPVYSAISSLAHIKRFINDGSTIRVRGLPFKVTEQEIMEFFQGFKFIPDSVQIDKDTSGRSSGEGWVTFFSPEEAKRAVRERNRQYLQKRYLELSVLQIPH